MGGECHKQHTTDSATFIHAGRFIDVLPENGKYLVYEVCADGLGGVKLCQADSFEQAVTDAEIVLSAEFHLAGSAQGA